MKRGWSNAVHADNDSSEQISKTDTTKKGPVTNIDSAWKTATDNAQHAMCS